MTDCELPDDLSICCLHPLLAFDCPEPVCVLDCTQGERELDSLKRRIKMRKMRASGMTCAEIAALEGITERSVRRAISQKESPRILALIGA